MKNLQGLVAAILFLSVIGCGCPGLISQMGRSDGDSTPSTSPSPASNSITISTPDDSSPTRKSGEYDLSLAKFNQLKDGMARSEVERILGGPGEKISSSTGGGVTFSVYKWQGPDYTSIILSFRDDKIMTKSQVGLK